MDETPGESSAPNSAEPDREPAEGGEIPDAGPGAEHATSEQQAAINSEDDPAA